jgi:rare lipoprotein A
MVFHGTMGIALSETARPSLALLFFLMKRLLLSLLLLCPLPAQAASLQCGRASHYGIGDGYHGQRAANGSRFDAYGLTAAHPSLPFGTKVLVKNRNNGKAVAVTITDRGPYAHGRILDLSYGSFSRIASPSQGEASICISKL